MLAADTASRQRGNVNRRPPAGLAEGPGQRGFREGALTCYTRGSSPAARTRSAAAKKKKNIYGGLWRASSAPLRGRWCAAR
jgi:hypothetical protein